jgi:acetoin utilization deacetylase AcuC-like enzyme
MIDINRKISKDFLEIAHDISIQKAFELLSNSKVNTLIFIDNNGSEFYYITNYIINQSIQSLSDTSGPPLIEIAAKSIIFKIDRYLESDQQYLEVFRKLHLKNRSSESNLILVTNNGKPYGLMSDIDLSNLPKRADDTSKSLLDEFMDVESKPVENIDEFYTQVEQLGFKLNNDLKNYIKYILKIRLAERDKATLLNLSKLESGEEADNNQVYDDMSNPNSDLESAIDDSTITAEHTSKGISIIYNQSHINHRPDTSSPETPERITKIMALLKDREKIFNDKCRLISDYSPATETDVLRVHTRQYVNFIKSYSSKGGGFLGDSTYLTSDTYMLALLAVGGSFKAGDEVITGNSDFSIGLVRPPGHHATRDKYGGYCIFNNAAALARYLQVNYGLKKILILDWDAHAANGTMDIFYNDPTVMLISLHQDPHDYYPKTGFGSQMGKLEGLGYTINVEMPRGSGDKDYLKVFNELILPLYDKFDPDFVIGCNGFDSHHSDPYTDLQLTANGYYEFCKIFRKKMFGKMVILMEGGYNPYMGELAHTLVNGLLGLPIPCDDKYHSLTHKLVSSEKTSLILDKKLKELHLNLSRYRIL